MNWREAPKRQRYSTQNRREAPNERNDCPPQFKGACCGGTKEWGIKEEDGKGVLDNKTGDRNWFCHACGFELDPPADPPVGSRARIELSKRAALKRKKER